MDINVLNDVSNQVLCEIKQGNSLDKSLYDKFSAIILDTTKVSQVMNFEKYVELKNYVFSLIACIDSVKMAKSDIVTIGKLASIMEMSESIGLMEKCISKYRSEFVVLYFISHNPGITYKELSKNLIKKDVKNILKQMTLDSIVKVSDNGYSLTDLGEEVYNKLSANGKLLDSIVYSL